MAKPQKIQNIVSTPVTRKHYQYNLNDVALGFDLSQDTEGEMIAFKRMMIQGLADIEKDLAKLKK